MTSETIELIESNDVTRSWTYQRGVNNQIKLAILAAGLGKRMDPLTTHYLPKPMFPLGGCVPMTEMWVRRGVEAGITDISMNLCVLGNTIKNHFQDGTKFGAHIKYVEEDVPSGTLGGVCKQALGNRAKPVYATEPPLAIPPFQGTTIIAPSGDIISNFGSALLEEMYDIHKKKGAALTMVLSPVPWDQRGEFGTVELESPEVLTGEISRSGRIVKFREKDPQSPSNLNNASIYMIEMDLLKALDPLRTAADPSLNEPFYDFGKHVFPAMLGNLSYLSLPSDYVLWGIQYDGLWFDVGRKRDYLSVNQSFLDGDIPLELPYEKCPWGYVGTHVAIDFSTVRIIPPVVMGNHCTIAPGVTLGPYAVIGDDWTIDANAHIRHSVLWKRYSYFTENTNRQGREIRASERTTSDRHRIRRNVTIDQCILIGGDIDRDLTESAVNVMENGQLDVVSIDWIPGGTRA